MLQSPYNFMTDEILSEQSYYKIDVLESSYKGLMEGVTDDFLVTATTTYSQSLITEMIENVKNTLLAFYQKVLSALNNFILNIANLADKYRELIKKRFNKLDKPFTYSSYTYYRLFDKDYPDIDLTRSDFVNAVEKLRTDIKAKNLPGELVEIEVNKIIDTFSRRAINDSVSPVSVRDSAHVILEKAIRGVPVIKTLEYKDIDKFCDEIKNAGPMKKELTNTKNAIMKTYNEMKKSYASAIRYDLQAEGTIKDLKNPGFETMRSIEYQRFAKINLEINRLFNACITIYNEAFNMKLQVMQDKIDENRSIIVDLLTRTGIMAAIYTKAPKKANKPIDYDKYIIKT